MQVVISVVGKDQVGILAKVATKCYGSNANIVDVSQKVMQDFFTMIMVVEWRQSNDAFHQFINDMDHFGNEMNLKIHVMHEDIFNAMHSIQEIS